MEQVMKSKERGVTLVELMIVVCMLGMVVAAMYNMFNFQQKSYSVQDNVAVMQQNIRVGLEYMVKEIRMAGYIPEDIPLPEMDPPLIYIPPPANDSISDSFDFRDGVSEAIDEATASAITFEADVDDDDSTEMVRYVLAFDAAQNSTNLTREVWEWSGANWGSSAGAQIIADNIDTITFNYSLLADDQGLDDDVNNDGDGDTDEEGELKSWNFATDRQLNAILLRGYIRQINLTMVARVPAPDSNYINPQQGDHYRRKTLASNISLRNLK